MQLHDIHVQELRRFRTPVSISGLQPGLNILAGPNEAGKSTIVRAIRAAFFERHRSSTVHDLQPWGDSSAAPEVGLRFEHEGVQYELVKRFLGRKRCDVTVGHEQHNGQEAEDLIARLMGFEFASRGGSKPENWGIPGLLWIEQGTGQEWQPSVGHALGHLRGALVQGIDEVAASAGDAVLAQVETLRQALLTANTNKPTGVYKDALAQEQEASTAYAEVLARLHAYRQQVDELAALRAAHVEDERTQPWVDLQARHDAALAAWRRVDAQAQELQRARARMLEWQQRRALLQAQLTQHERDQAALAECKTRCEAAQVAHDAASGGVLEADVALRDARVHWDEARAALVQAQTAVQAAETHEQNALLTTQLQELASTLLQAQGWAQQLLAAERSTLPVEPSAADMKALQAIHDECRQLMARGRLLATRLRVTLVSGQSILLDGERLEGDTQHDLFNETVVSLPGIGELTITPGGDDLGSLQTQRQTLVQRLLNLVQRMQLQSCANAGLSLETDAGLTACLSACWDEAQAAQQSHQQHRLAIQQAQQALALLAPQGLTALEARVQSLRERAAVSDLEATAAARPLHEVKAQAQLAVATEQAAQQKLERVQQLAQNARQKAASSEAALAHHLAEAQRLQTRLTDMQHLENLQITQRQLTEVLAQLHVQDEALQTLQADIDNAQPDVLQRDVKRFEQAATLARQQHQARQIDLARLESTLQTEGAQGLDEQLAALEAQQLQAQRRVAECQRRADALTLLRDKLQSHRQALTTRLQAPLQNHLQRYLRMLFPQASLTLDDQLQATVLLRPGSAQAERSEVDALSFGAREQLGIVSRLAYADLLREAGRPTLLILDDALVHTDTERLDAMKQVLLDAAERHQILLFTCHPGRWRDLGVPMRSLPSVSA